MALARWRIPGETGSQARAAGPRVLTTTVTTQPIGQRSRVDQATIRGRTSANLGYSKPLFACVHRIFGHQFIAPGGEKKEPDVGDGPTASFILSVWLRGLRGTRATYSAAHEYLLCTHEIIAS